MRYFMFHEGKITIFPSWNETKMIPGAYLRMEDLRYTSQPNEMTWILATGERTNSWKWVDTDKVPKEVLTLNLLI